MRFGLWYDVRHPEGSPRLAERVYAETLEQIAWAETLGLGSVWLGEHHFTTDGYLASPLVFAAAIAARTKTMRIGTAVMAAPLHDPVRLAEDAAAVSLLSGGRFDLGLGMGYRDLEFAVLGRNKRHRPSLFEEGVEVIRRAFAGESIACDGKRFSYPDVKVTPLPVHPPRILIGGGSQPAIDRAARIGDGFLSLADEHISLYLDAVERQGRSAAAASVHVGKLALIEPDPERAWAAGGDHVLKQINDYIDWGSFGPMPPFADREALREAGFCPIWDAPRAAESLSSMLREFPQIEDLYIVPQFPGESVAAGSARIEYFVNEVIPGVEDRLATLSPAPSATISTDR